MSFDAEQQRRTQLMMAALASQGTVDELGLGTARDLIAGALHPGRRRGQTHPEVPCPATWAASGFRPFLPHEPASAAHETPRQRVRGSLGLRRDSTPVPLQDKLGVFC